MNCYEPEERCADRRCCPSLKGAICFLALLIALAAGIILGVVYAEPFLPALPAVIAFAAALAAVVLALLIYRRKRS